MREVKTPNIKLEVNESFTRELNVRVILETMNKKMVEMVSMIVEGLGFANVLIRGVSNKSFLGFFHLE